MAIVGPDHQAVFSAVLQDVRKIIVGLARDVEAVAAEQVFLEVDRQEGPAKFLCHQIGIEIRHPGSAGFDESHSKFWKHVRDTMLRERAESRDGIHASI